MPKIAALSSELAAHLRNSLVLLRPSHCVEELVYNSIDAGANSVAVRVDLTPSNIRIQVIDDGCGISQEDLSVFGNQHCTSKCNSLKSLEIGLKTHGYRGEAIAALKASAKSLKVISQVKDGDIFTIDWNEGIR